MGLSQFFGMYNSFRDNPALWYNSDILGLSTLVTLVNFLRKKQPQVTKKYQRSFFFSSTTDFHFFWNVSELFLPCQSIRVTGSYAGHTKINYYFFAEDAVIVDFDDSLRTQTQKHQNIFFITLKKKMKAKCGNERLIALFSFWYDNMFSYFAKQK
jgi:hypothetical protein